MILRPVEWAGEIPGVLRILDQRRLPGEEVILERRSVKDLFEDIRTLAVRGAPAIGVAAAFGVVLGVQEAESAEAQHEAAGRAIDLLATSRPTAVNLFAGLERMGRERDRLMKEACSDLRGPLLETARAFFEEDLELCRAIGDHGAGLIRDDMGVLTHCNAGGLATSGFGTALGVLYRARELGRTFQVYADETRPLLQGARLTAWELARAGLDPVLLCDNAAGWAMARGKIDLVVVGADRIAGNGDTANKIGTYPVAVLARRHSIPFYIAAPSTTFDLSLASGRDIPIEERDGEEVFLFGGQRTAPEGIRAYNPAFDVTPAGLITGIITEKGVIEEPDEKKVRALIGTQGP